MARESARDLVVRQHRPALIHSFHYCPLVVGRISSKSCSARTSARRSTVRVAAVRGGNPKPSQPAAMLAVRSQGTEHTQKQQLRFVRPVVGREIEHERLHVLKLCIVGGKLEALIVSLW